MIDLHCHMLPGIDDGAPDQETALAMARIAVADG
ncbi:MAG: CpsB/CapC family capsule biosynthesis tyrosine phosphatase, partial [Betaproteobacteria bacterium]